MTNTQTPFGGARGVAFPTVPTGDVVATFSTYAEAQAAVDKLADTDDFPVQAASIIGSDMKSVERVTGRLSWGRAAGAGAASGLWIGLLFGLLITLFTPPTGSYFAELFGAILIGAAFGMVFGLISYGLTRRRRDFSSVMQIVASSYSIVVGGDSANRARNILGTEQGTTRTTTIQDADLDEQPLGPGSGGPGAAA